MRFTPASDTSVSTHVFVEAVACPIFVVVEPEPCSFGGSGPMSVDRLYFSEPRQDGAAFRPRRRRIPPNPAALSEFIEDIAVPIPEAFRLEDGARLCDTHIALRRFGRKDGPIVFAAGGISADKNICGEGGWWTSIAGPHRGIDTERCSLFGFDFAPNDAARVSMSPRTQARLLEIALDHLKIERIDAFIGASYGGMTGLAFAALAPKRIQRLCVISAAHRPAPLAQAWRGVQRRTVEFAIEQGKPAEGLALARQLAMTTYRSAAEFRERFHGLLAKDGHSDIDRYLIARGAVYAKDVSPERWLSLSEAIDRTMVTPEAIEAETTLIACPDDQLVPFADVVELAKRAPNFKALHALPSIYGHDAFLKEPGRLAPMLKAFLGSAHDDA
jgi:homoserine O-acetyltransferase/O-succinyltransferase